MSLGNEMAASTLGEKLLAAVRNLWAEVQRLSKIVNYQGEKLEDVIGRVATLEQKLKGARISSGKQKAKNTKLEAKLTESEQTLAGIKSILNPPNGQQPRPN